LSEQVPGMVHAARRFLMRLGWTVVWMCEHVYLNLLRTTPRCSVAPDLDPGAGASSPGAIREALKLDEQRQALRLSDIWGRSQRIEHEIAERQRARHS